MMFRKKTFTDSIYKRILPSQVIANVSGFVAMIIDSVLVARFLGVSAVSACGLITPLMVLLVAIAQMIYYGNQMICGTEIGKGDIKEANRVFSASLITMIIVAVVCVALIMIFETPLCILLGAPGDSELLELTKSYLNGYIIGAPGFMCLMILPGVLQLDGDRATAVRAIVILMISDVALDLINVLLIHGGLFGMGLATALSNYIALFVMVLHFFKKDAMLRVTIKNIGWKRMPEVIKRGTPQAIYSICRTVMTILLNRILLQFGSAIYVAAYSVISNIGNCIMSVGAGIGSISLMVTGVAYGEEDRETLKDIVRAIARQSIIYNVVLIVVVEIAAPFIIDLFFNGSADVRDIAVWGLRLYALFLIFYSLNCGYRVYIQGLGKLKKANFQNVLENVFVLLSAFLLSYLAGIRYVWLAFLLGHMLTFLYFVLSTFWEHRKISLNAENFLFVDKDFGIPKEDSLECYISSIDDAIGLSEKASMFCKEKAGNKRMCMLLPLCVEEMAVNVVKHGFSDGKKHYLQVRILYKSGEWIIRLRDDCRLFSPKEYEEIHHGDDPVANIGIRMISKIVKEMSYFNTLKLNNVLIKI